MRTPLITRKGYQQLSAELDHLWRVERPEITKKVTWAASLGDRSENADLVKEPQSTYYPDHHTYFYWTTIIVHILKRILFCSIRR